MSNKSIKNTKIISGFPGVGKSYAYKKMTQTTDYVVLDSDSSNFSWIKDLQDNNTEERNPNFPDNYIKHIKDNIGKADIIFVSSHDVVQQALQNNGIKYTMIYPDISLKEEWLNRFRSRGNSEIFIKTLDIYWEEFINDIEQNNYHRKIKLQSGEYLSDNLL